MKNPFQQQTLHETPNGKPAIWPTTESRTAVPLTVAEVLATLDGRLTHASKDNFRLIPTGFSPLDEALNGGLHTGDLFLLAGAQGAGKTTLSMQMARNIAAGGEALCLYLCFEHDEVQLLVRLLAMESVLAGTGLSKGLKLGDVQRLFGDAAHQRFENLDALVASDPRLEESLELVQRYQDRLLLLQASGQTTTLAAVEQLVDDSQRAFDRPVVLFIDYLQKVPADRVFATEMERIAWVTQSLKDLALRKRLSVVAIAALELEGLRAQRLHVHHLWGGSALAYEADVILMLAEKADCIARVNYEFNPQKVQSFRDWVVASVAKNRFGRNLLDLEFRKQFAYGCFDPCGGFVSEKLIDERIYRE